MCGITERVILREVSRARLPGQTSFGEAVFLQNEQRKGQIHEDHRDLERDTRQPDLVL